MTECTQACVVDVVWDQAALFEAMGVGLPQVKQEFAVLLSHKERLGMHPELCHGLVADLRADFIAFRACAGADAGHQVLGSTLEISLHIVNEVGSDARDCGSPGRVCKPHGFALFFCHEYEGAVRTFTHEDQAGPVCVQGVSLANESGPVTVQGCGPMNLVQPGTLFCLQGLDDLLHGLIGMKTNLAAVGATARGYQMRDVQGIECPEMPCDPGVFLPGQGKTTV